MSEIAQIVAAGRSGEVAIVVKVPVIEIFFEFRSARKVGMTTHTPRFEANLSSEMRSVTTYFPVTVTGDLSYLAGFVSNS